MVVLQEFNITVEEHNDTTSFTVSHPHTACGSTGCDLLPPLQSTETKGNHSSVILDRILACTPIRQRLNAIPIPIELYSQAVQLFRFASL